VISHVGGNVDLPRSTGNDVNLHELLPQGANSVVVVASAAGSFDNKLCVEGGIALGVQSELQGFHAVILR
jgi:hypothetical protein